MTGVGFPDPVTYKSWVTKISNKTGINESQIHDEVRQAQKTPGVYLTDIAAIQIVAKTYGVKL